MDRVADAENPKEPCDPVWVPVEPDFVQQAEDFLSVAHLKSRTRSPSVDLGNIFFCACTFFFWWNGTN